ncbi:hypothetical protein RDWZM_009681 [Blomia tropicalis]|uniref:Uncharacterized protein n=1 Tax=Blomia tropicalis TaxID=40697 RepID=A0A9Q0M453_BLOTA|nr:hypothetical protein RDWZM_009681 [Blomia tropicalis]
MYSLSPFFPYLLLYLFFFSHVIPNSSAAQKFYPNGRYGRRSDLPPLFPVMDESGSLISKQDNYVGHESNPLEEYVPMWCTEIDRKVNLFKCLDRFQLKLLKQQSQQQAMDRSTAPEQVQP